VTIGADGHSRPGFVRLGDSVFPAIRSGRGAARSTGAASPPVISSRPGGGSPVGPAAPPTATRREAPGSRIAYFDNLKVALVAAVIVGHAGNFYGAGAGWIGVSPATGPSYASAATLGMAAAIGQMFVMGTFFFMAGSFTPGSLARKGAGPYLRGRLLRVGVPLAASVLLIMPVSWLAGVLATTGSLRQAWDDAAKSVAYLDPGVAWFLTELLIFSALFVAYRRWRPAQAGGCGPLRARHLLAASALIAALTFPARLLWPIGSYQLLGLHLWLWPQCLTLFWLGALAAERGWLDDLGRNLRAYLWAAVAAAAVAMALGWIASGASADFGPFRGGWHWQALGTAIIEGVFAVCLSVLLIGWFRRHLSRQGRLAAVMSRDAYAAFVLQVPVLVAGALLLRDVPVTGDVKFAVLAVAGVAGTFAAAHALRRQIPLTRRII
jgi:acyltransferase-like protein